MNHLHKAKVTSPYEIPTSTSHSPASENNNNNKKTPAIAHSRKTTIIIKVRRLVRSSLIPTRRHGRSPTYTDPPPVAKRSPPSTECSSANVHGTDGVGREGVLGCPCGMVVYA